MLYACVSDGCHLAVYFVLQSLSSAALTSLTIICCNL